MSSFNPGLMKVEDLELAFSILGRVRLPDVDIEPDGKPYLYRWHVIGRNPHANVYLHVQVASDPERPLHDHPWDNQSVILSGGYDEVLQTKPPWGNTRVRPCYQGQTYTRKAEEAHRLILPEQHPYTMTLFSTGPVRRKWGFWIIDYHGMPQWADHEECVTVEGSRSTFHVPKRLV